MPFLEQWDEIYQAMDQTSSSFSVRPNIQTMLHDNVTISGTWVETEFSNVTSRFEEYGLIINNITLAMPHPGKSLPLPPKRAPERHS